MSGIELSDVLVALKRELGLFALRGRQDGEVPLHVREIEVEITTSASASDAPGAPVTVRVATGEQHGPAFHTHRITIRLAPGTHEPLELGS
jgi:hypothetical protein